MRSEEDKAESRELLLAFMEASRQIVLGEVATCVALEQLLEQPDVGAPVVARLVDEECGRLGIAGTDRLSELRQKRTEAQARADNIARNITSIREHGRLADPM